MKEKIASSKTEISELSSKLQSTTEDKQTSEQKLKKALS